MLSIQRRMLLTKPPKRDLRRMTMRGMWTVMRMEKMKMMKRMLTDTSVVPLLAEQGDEEDDDGGAHNGGGAWGAEWTARKAAASSLDNLSHMYRENILEVVLPLISRKLEHESWEVQESGVLALGAIAFGCMEGLTQYMPKVMDHLLKLCQAPKPLLR
eukprot:symbB.v1.2.038094.t1/scaffold5821.1/size23324/1